MNKYALQKITKKELYYIAKVEITLVLRDVPVSPEPCHAAGKGTALSSLRH